MTDTHRNDDLHTPRKVRVGPHLHAVHEVDGEYTRTACGKIVRDAPQVHRTNAVTCGACLTNLRRYFREHEASELRPAPKAAAIVVVRVPAAWVRRIVKGRK